MTEETQPVTVIGALTAVMAEVRSVGKDGYHQQQNFKFRGIDGVVNAVGPAFRQHGVVCLPIATEARYRDVQTSTGKPSRECTVIVTYRFYGPAGDFIDAQVPGESMDSGDKGTPKAMSVAYRSLLLQALCIPTDEPDPDLQTYERAHPPIPEVPPLAKAKGRAWNAMLVLHPDWPQDERTQATETELAARGSSIADATTETWNALAEELEARAA